MSIFGNHRIFSRYPSLSSDRVASSAPSVHPKLVRTASSSETMRTRYTDENALTYLACSNMQFKMQATPLLRDALPSIASYPVPPASTTASPPPLPTKTRKTPPPLPTKMSKTPPPLPTKMSKTPPPLPTKMSKTPPLSLPEINEIKWEDPASQASKSEELEIGIMGPISEEKLSIVRQITTNEDRIQNLENQIPKLKAEKAKLKKENCNPFVEKNKKSQKYNRLTSVKGEINRITQEIEKLALENKRLKCAPALMKNT